MIRTFLRTFAIIILVGSNNSRDQVLLIIESFKSFKTPIALYNFESFDVIDCNYEDFAYKETTIAETRGNLSTVILERDNKGQMIGTED